MLPSWNLPALIPEDVPSSYMLPACSKFAVHGHTHTHTHIHQIIWTYVCNAHALTRTHICMHTSKHTHTHTHTHTHIFTHLAVKTSLFHSCKYITYIQTLKYIHKNACRWQSKFAVPYKPLGMPQFQVCYVCMYVCKHVCMYVNMYVCLYTDT
jgi:hypothetical protein